MCVRLSVIVVGGSRCFAQVFSYVAVFVYVFEGSECNPKSADMLVILCA